MMMSKRSFEQGDENKFGEVIKALKGLKKVKAPENFDTELFRRIRYGEINLKEKSRSTFFIPLRWASSVGLAAAAVTILFVINVSSEEPENPFAIEPKVREDMIVSYPDEDAAAVEKKVDEVQTTKKSSEKSEIKEPPAETRTPENLAVQSHSDSELILRDETSAFYSPDAVVGAAPAAQVSYGINKSGLNFRSVQLNEKEKAELIKMREKLLQSVSEIEKKE